jgi:hypothetical protein
VKETSFYKLVLRQIAGAFFFLKSVDTISGKEECNFLLTCLPAMHESK